MIGPEFIINTISLGSLYALIALGLVFVYGILKLVNFAYGEYIMVGGYALFVLGGISRSLSRSGPFARVRSPRCWSRRSP
jgi:branched-subunit amino acid ABC-type transport system permease component